MSLIASFNSTGFSEGRVLVVDDDIAHQEMERVILARAGFDVDVVSNGKDALVQLYAKEYDVVILDKRMPGMNGDEVCFAIRNELNLNLLPVIMVTGNSSQNDIVFSLECGASDFVRKPFNTMELVARVKSCVNQKKVTDQLESAESMLYAMARLVEARDENTGDHCTRLQRYCVKFGAVLGLDSEEQLALERGSILHDIGKVAIPDAILLKRGALTDAEKTIMRTHPVVGAELCEGLKSIRSTIPVIRHHHERFDGSGYPDGLAGSDIPLLAQVFQIVDVYDALISDRPYKPSMSHEQAAEIMFDEVRKGWRNAELVYDFLQCVNKESRDHVDEFGVVSF